ncbi:hypothetical protein RhiJN_27325 [Ceratobasidium sp. AG-Ba]|nr:hypothetical protein RhiJN_13236 [Ceratobasidium sp. AG-Ba]QRV99306.1 hypothetical protein RhiJN_27325 [Ceratobasidium sp. AG-Ba]
MSSVTENYSRMLKTHCEIQLATVRSKLERAIVLAQLHSIRAVDKNSRVKAAEKGGGNEMMEVCALHMGLKRTPELRDGGEEAAAAVAVSDSGHWSGKPTVEADAK